MGMMSGFGGSATGYAGGMNGCSNGATPSPPVLSSTGKSAASARRTAPALVTSPGSAASSNDSSPLDAPSRDWTLTSDDGATSTVNAQFVGLLDSRVVLRTSDEHIKLVPVEQLSTADQSFLAGQAVKPPVSSVALGQ